MENRESVAIGSRIKTARERMHWTQEQLAAALGWKSFQIASSVENGQRELKARELAKIASVLNSSFESLLGVATTQPSILWRAKPKDDKAGEIESVFIRRCERYAQLEKWCDIPPAMQLKPLSVKSDRESINLVQREAENLRDAMKLGGKPGCTLKKTLEEDYGVKIFHEELGKNGSALCAQVDFGFAVLLNASEPRWRRNYSLAHELFHLMTSPLWDSPRCEVLADAFASALLLPEESLMSSMRSRAKGKKVSLQDFVAIACEFDVSIDALCWRLVNLGKLKKELVLSQLSDGSKLREFDKYSRRNQQDEVKAGLPERYTRLSYMAYSKGKIGRSKLAEYLEMSLFDLVKELNSNSETLASAEAEIAVVGC